MNTKNIKQEIIHYGIIALGMLTLILDQTLASDAKWHIYVMVFGVLVSVVASKFTDKQKQDYKLGEKVGTDILGGMTVQEHQTNIQEATTAINRSTQAIINQTDTSNVGTV